MTRRTCTVAITLLFLTLAVPALGKNYSLHSPKLWTPQEKEQYEKENPPVVNEKELAEKQKERLKKEKELIEKQKELIKKEKIQAEKEREQVKKENEKVKKEKTWIKKNQILVKDGVSYREVTAQKGDTLYSISRKYSKEGSSYAGTLRFNDIQDPDQIISGDVIKVPLFQEKKAKQRAAAKQLKLPTVLPKQQTAAKITNKPVSELSVNYVKQPVASKKELPAKAIISPPEQPTTVPAKACIPQQLTFSNNSSSGPKLFEQAIKSYRSGDCQTAIQLFGRYLSEQPTSALAADASLFIADCYLKLSGK
jgi:TolA-binding protein